MTQEFHEHLDGCAQCRNHPMALCVEGARILQGSMPGADRDTPPMFSERKMFTPRDLDAQTKPLHAEIERLRAELAAVLSSPPVPAVRASEAQEDMQIVEDMLAAAELCAEMSQCEDRDIRDAWKSRYKRFRVYADRALPLRAPSQTDDSPAVRASGEPQKPLTDLESQVASLTARLEMSERQYERIANLLDNYGIPRWPPSAVKARLQRMYRAWNVPGADVSLTPYTHEEFANASASPSDGARQPQE